MSRTADPPDFVHFESGHVHPVAITPDGTRLLVVNTPDNRLSVFDLTGEAPVRIAEIPVGLEPVSVAARGDGEAWVVNNVSDDVSVVDLTTRNVRATIRVGDEPSDVVFAAGRAYVSVSQEDALKAYDPADLAAPPVVIPIPGRMPRALAVGRDGGEVLVCVFHSSAGATVLSAEEVGDSLPPPDPPMAPSLPAAPPVGLIVQHGPDGWVDEAGHHWDHKIPYEVPKVELVYVGTASNTVESARGDLATTMLGVATSPVDGAAAVTGTLAFVAKRLEPNLRGRFTEQRLAIVPGRNGPVTGVHLNQGFDYGVTPGPASETDSAIGMPTGVCWSPDGQRVYVTSLASNRVAVLDAGGVRRARVPVVSGPTGILADPARARLYVVGRFHNELQTLSTASMTSLAVTSIGFDPTPAPIVNGRRFFYGGFTSGHGDQSCASCHLFGDMDNLAWDLGDPRGSMAPPPLGMFDPLLKPIHPMKGPLVTQTLRGLPGTGVLHWRGDRANLAAFNPAFVGLLGRASMLPDSEMAAFSDFVLPLVHPPNPSQRLDRGLADAPPGQPSASRGREFFTTTPVDGGLTCANCHRLPLGTNGEVVNAAAIVRPQDMKVPHLRNLYRKTGFKDSTGVVNKRGFGLSHDGSIDDLRSFLLFPGFNFGASPEAADAKRRDVESFLLSFDTGMAPAVGQQITFDGSNRSSAALLSRLDTLETQADLGDCDLVAKGLVGGVPRGWSYQGSGRWKSDVATDASLSRSELVALAANGGELTVTGVASGSGRRSGIDRDRDGFLDGDERAAGTDPGDPASHPSGGVATGPRSGLQSVSPNPFQATTTIQYLLTGTADVTLEVHDVLGRRVRLLDRGNRPTGTHAVAWDGRSDDGGLVPSGLYFVRLGSGRTIAHRAVVFIR